MILEGEYTICQPSRSMRRDSKTVFCDALSLVIEVRYSAPSIVIAADLGTYSKDSKPYSPMHEEQLEK